MSLIAMVENIIVEKHKLLTHEAVLDGITLANLLPGPMAVNVVTYVGYRLRGVYGAVVSAFAVLLPSFILVVILSHLYFYNSNQINLTSIFKGITPAVAGIVLSVAIKMLKKNANDKIEYIFILIAFILLFIMKGDMKVFSPFVIVITYGIIGYFSFKEKEENKSNNYSRIKIKFNIKNSISLLGLVVILLLPLMNSQGDSNGLFKLGSTFGGLSLMLFGGGYVFIPMIQEVVVQKYAWLNNQQFIDGIAIGQFTPGPIVISVAFIGYYIKGIMGAVVATFAIFTPPAILMIIATKVMDFFKHNHKIKAVLKFIRLGIIGMIFYAVLVILSSSFTGDYIVASQYIFIFVVTFVVLYKFNTSIIWVIFFSGITGYLFF